MKYITDEQFNQYVKDMKELEDSEEALIIKNGELIEEIKILKMENKKK